MTATGRALQSTLLSANRSRIRFAIAPIAIIVSDVIVDNGADWTANATPEKSCALHLT
jgi:hypothetical protein